MITDAHTQTACKQNAFGTILTVAATGIIETTTIKHTCDNTCPYSSNMQQLTTTTNTMRTQYMLKIRHT